jgi:hypothetical protein
MDGPRKFHFGIGSGFAGGLQENAMARVRIG